MILTAGQLDHQGSELGMHMSHHEDTAYYQRRAAEELERAAEATGAAAAAVHSDLAYRYGALAALSDVGRPKRRSCTSEGATRHPILQREGRLDGDGRVRSHEELAQISMLECGR